MKEADQEQNIDTITEYKRIAVKKEPSFSQLIHKQQIKSMLEELDINSKLSNVSYQQQPMLEAVNYLQQYQGQILFAERFKLNNFFLHISHITFSKLTSLNLSRCDIQTIEYVPWILLPELQQLTSTSNPINSILPLRKANMPKLKRLVIQVHYIKDYKGLVQANFKDLKIINFFGQKRHQNIAVLLKIPSNYFYFIKVVESKIRQQNKRQRFRKRFLKSQITL